MWSSLASDSTEMPVWGKTAVLPQKSSPRLYHHGCHCSETCSWSQGWARELVTELGLQARGSTRWQVLPPHLACPGPLRWFRQVALRP